MIERWEERRVGREGGKKEAFRMGKTFGKSRLGKMLAITAAYK